MSTESHAFYSIIEVQAERVGQAERVITERVLSEEDYGFPYTISTNTDPIEGIEASTFYGHLRDIADAQGWDADSRSNLAYTFLADLCDPGTRARFIEFLRNTAAEENAV